MLYRLTLAEEDEEQKCRDTDYKTEARMLSGSLWTSHDPAETHKLQSAESVNHRLSALHTEVIIVVFGGQFKENAKKTEDGTNYKTTAGF